MLAPLQDHWAPLILLIVAIIDLLLYVFDYHFIDYRLIWLLYVGAIGPIYLVSQVRRLVKTQTLHHGYQRLVCCKKQIKFPQDDFL